MTYDTSSQSRFIHWLTAPSVTPKARAISLWFQPCCLSSQALSPIHPTYSIT